MRVRTAFQVFVVLLFSLACIALPAAAVDSVDEVKPQITVSFKEKVVIVSYFLKSTTSGAVIPVTMTSQPAENTYIFTPTKSLSNGRHRFVIFASDLVGNPDSYTYEFDVFVPGTRIILTKPNSIGVSNSTKFPVAVYTSRPSVCKYTGISVSSFSDVRLKFFDETGDLSSSSYESDHEIANYTVEPDFPKKLYVVCMDDLGRENSQEFTIYADVTPPRLKVVKFIPSPILEYPPGGNLYSVLSVDASEPVICRYTQNPNATYSDMTAFTDITAFTGIDKITFGTYKEQNEEKINFPGDVVKKTYTFYVQCEDRAGWKSVKFIRPLSIDLSEGLKIQVNSPPKMSKKTAVFLNVTTNRKAYCVYKSTTAGSGDPTSYTDSTAKLSSSYTNLATTHYKKLGTKSAGRYTIRIRCDVPAGVALEALDEELEYSYTIDQTPPSVPKVNATTPVCDNTLKATFKANDTISGISEYRWVVGTTGVIMANGTTSGDSISVSKSNNGTSFALSTTASYVFSVRAVDGAGNVGSAGLSNSVTYDATGTSCDNTPPVVTLLRSEAGDAVTIKCTDDKSNCTSIGSYYGTSYEQPCNSTQYWLDPVVIPLFRTTIVCWDIKDKAGNVNKGSQIVKYNLSALNLSDPSAVCAGGVDNDGDGYGENCLLGSDCDDTDANVSVGCTSGCVQDLDGDGYGLGCTLGDDCNGQNPNLTTNCPNNCISDNDGDEFGLGCTNGPDCKGDDSSLQVSCPNGCVDDNDGDSYGLKCPVGFDCHGEQYLSMTTCTSECLQDTDGDGYGVYCALGLDCDGGDPYLGQNCTDGCVFDEDGDGYGFGCIKGLDCDGMDPLTFSDCANNCLSDNDGDGYGWKCDSGADCNDTDPNVNLDCTLTTDCVSDQDGDGYGLGCEAGADCDDYDFTITSNCTTNCTNDEDCNRLPDEWQDQYFNNTVCNDTTWCDPDADPDDDGYTNLEEYRRGTHPLQKDEVKLPAETAAEDVDADGDGMPDACEKLYGLNPSDPYDYDKDQDKDGLTNKFECTYKKGLCVNWLNPTSPDSDNDGYNDKEEVDAGTDPCDPESHPSAGIIPWLLLILGILAILGSVGYLIYKKYYIPLVSPPPKPTAAPGAGRPAARRAGVPPPGARHHVRPRRLPPRRPAGPSMSRDRFEKELQKRAQERESVLKAFGEKKAAPKKPAKVMEEIARKPVEVRRAPVAKPAAPAKQPPKADYVSKLSKVVGGDYFDKLEGMSRKEADYFGKLATITKKKKVPIEDDQVSKLASITKSVSEDRTKMRKLETAFEKSEMDKLDSFLTTRKHVDTFIKEEAPAKGAAKAATAARAPADDTFAALSEISAGKGGMDALESLSKPKRKDVMGELTEMTSKKAQKTALSKMEALSSMGSKAELFRAFRQMSREKGIDKNVFEVLLSYLMKSGKISKRDVSEILFDLEKQGVLSKKHIAEVFFNLGIKK
jgi:hypothetical protein